MCPPISAKHEYQTHKKGAGRVGPNAIRAERSEQETDRATEQVTCYRDYDSSD